jgi:hypothetical protein
VEIKPWPAEFRTCCEAVISFFLSQLCGSDALTVDPVFINLASTRRKGHLQLFPSGLNKPMCIQTSSGSCWHLISRFRKVNLECPIDNPTSSRTEDEEEKFSSAVWSTL